MVNTFKSEILQTQHAILSISYISRRARCTKLRQSHEERVTSQHGYSQHQNQLSSFRTEKCSRFADKLSHFELKEYLKE